MRRSPTQRSSLPPTVLSKVLLPKVVVLALLVFSVSPARADRGPADNRVDSRKLYYCGCDQAAGAPICASMCDLPQYRNSASASPCHNRRTVVRPQVTPAPLIHPRKGKRFEDARLE